MTDVITVNRGSRMATLLRWSTKNYKVILLQENDLDSMQLAMKNPMVVLLSRCAVCECP